MIEKTRTRAQAIAIVIGAIVIGLVLIGVWSDGFGLSGSQMAPGTTTPPNNPS